MCRNGAENYMVLNHRILTRTSHLWEQGRWEHWEHARSRCIWTWLFAPESASRCSYILQMETNGVASVCSSLWNAAATYGTASKLSVFRTYFFVAFLVGAIETLTLMLTWLDESQSGKRCIAVATIQSNQAVFRNALCIFICAGF